MQHRHNNYLNIFYCLCECFLLYSFYSNNSFSSKESFLSFWQQGLQMELSLLVLNMIALNMIKHQGFFSDRRLSDGEILKIFFFFSQGQVTLWAWKLNANLIISLRNSRNQCWGLNILISRANLKTVRRTYPSRDKKTTSIKTDFLEIKLSV